MNSTRSEKTGNQTQKKGGMVSVQYKIIAVLVPVIMLGIAVITAFVCISTRKMFTKMNVKTMEMYSQSAVYEVTAWTQAITAKLDAQKHVIEFLNGRLDETTSYIRSTADSDSPYPDGIYIALEDGSYIFARWHPGEDYDPRNRVWYKEALKHNTFTFGDAYLDQISGSIVVSSSCVLRDEDSQVYGVASCDIQLTEISKIISNIRLEKTGGTFIVDSGSMILIGTSDNSRTGLHLSNTKKDSLYFPAKRLIEEEHYGFSRVEGQNGSQTMYYYLEQIPDCKWIAVSYVPEAEVISESNMLAMSIVIIGLFTVLILICLMYLLLFRMVIIPVGKLDASVQQIANGDLEVSIDLSSNDEFGRLADNLGKMTSRLFSYTGYINEIVVALDEIGGGNLAFRPSLDYKGEFSRVKVALVKITQSLSAAREKEEQAKNFEIEKNAADSANRAKSRFLAQMSHEIRTPINAVLGMNEMILNEAQDEQILDYSSNIDYAGRQLLSIINTILDFSKIEDGKMEIVPADYDLASVINNLVNAATLRAKMKSLYFNVHVDETIPAMLYGDDVRVTQVIQNILTNAVKYTEEGGVTFTVKNGGRDGEDVFLDVSVADTGIGIREEDMDKLCASFERLDTQRNRNIEGTGLGMAIVTNLLQMMGSKLQVDSIYGKGSTFSFHLRQRVVDERPIGNYSERLASSSRHREKDLTLHAPEARVLVVDDNDMNLKVAKNLLKLNGVRPDLAKSGSEAINMMREKEYDIVLMDHLMPVMDGIETLKMLHHENLIHPGTSVIALTANAVAGAREEYLAAGFVDYLSKPMNVQDLEEKLAKYLPGSKVTWRRKSETAESSAPQKTQPSPAVTDVPQTDGTKTVPPENTAKNISPDNAVKTVPQTDGIAKSVPQTDSTKTVPQTEAVKSGSASDSVQSTPPEEVLEFHPQDKIPETELQSGTEQEMLEFHPQEEPLEFEAEETVLEFGPADGSSGTAAPAKEDVISQLSAAGLHTEAGLRYCSDDKDFYQELLHDFCSEYPEKARELICFYEVENWDDYRIRIHALKSIAKTIGADDLSEQALKLETAASQSDAVYIRAHHTECLNLYRKLSGSITEIIDEYSAQE